MTLSEAQQTLLKCQERRSTILVRLDVYYHCTGNKGNAPNLTHEKKCLKRALPTYSRDLCSMMKFCIGSSMPCIRATLTRNDLDVMRLLVYRTNKASYRTGLISSTMIDLTDLSNRISLSVRHENGDKLRS